MSKFHSVILSPLITEKSAVAREENKYTFKVDKRASKDLIKESIEAIFSVKVESVRTINMLGKEKRMGRFTGKRSDWKKAVVKLAEGQTIAQFGDI